MRVIIEHGTLKRNITGPFNICGNGKDLKLLAETILSKLPSTEPDLWFGWIQIPDSHPQPTLVNTFPIPWESQ